MMEIRGPSDSQGLFRFRIYIAGQAPRSLAALANFNQFCRQYLKDRYELEIIDVVKDPSRAQSDDVFVVPTLVKTFPPPVMTVVGDLTDSKHMLSVFTMGQEVD